MNTTRYAACAAIIGFLLLISPNAAVGGRPGPTLRPRSAWVPQMVLFGQLRSLTDRHTAENLLKQARHALSEGNLELAEFYLKSAEKLKVDYGTVFARFVDTPQKVRTELNRRRSQQQHRNLANRSTADSDREKTASDPTNLTPWDPDHGDPDRIPTETVPDEMVDTAEVQARNYLSKGRKALAAGDVSSAIGWYQSAIATGATFGASEYSAEQLAVELRARGVPDSELSPPSADTLTLNTEITDPARATVATNGLPTALQKELRLDDPSQIVEQVNPEKVTASRLLERGELIKTTAENEQIDARTQVNKQAALRLLAQSQVALDRGELEVAEQLARAAQDLKVPDVAYEPGDPRPWMLLMDINKKQRQRDSHSASPQLATSENVFGAPPAPMAQSGESVSQIVQPSVYDPIHDTTQVRAATAEFPIGGTLGVNGFQVPSAHNIPSNLQLQSTEIQLAAAGSSADANEQPRDATQLLRETSPQLRDQPEPLQNLIQPPPKPPLVNSDLPVAHEFPAAPAETMDLAEASETPPAAQEVASDIPQTVPDVEPLPLEEVPPPEIESEGVKHYEAGREALQRQDFPTAREEFRAAWEYESELEPGMRQALQDNLQILRTAVTPPRSSPPPTWEDAELLTESPSLTMPPSARDQAAIEALIARMSRQQAEVRALRENDPTAAWGKLKELKELVATANVPSDARQRLVARVEQHMDEMESYIDKNRARIENDERNKQVLDEINRRREQMVRNQQQLAELVEEFNQLWDQQRFPEAVIVAKKAREVDPLNPVVSTMMTKSQVARQLMTNMLRNERFRGGTLGTIEQTNEAGVPMANDWGLEFPEVKYWNELTNSRKKLMESRKQRFSEVELEIQRALKTQVNVEFEDQQLSVVLEKLGRVAGVNVFLDPEGLSAEGVTSDTLVSIHLRKAISLKSALNLILQPLHLSYVIQDEVLRVTSEQARDGDVYPEVYEVADLVIPIPDFLPGNNIGLPGAIREAHNVLGQGYLGGAVHQRPLTLAADNPGLGTGATSASVLAQMGAANMLPHGAGNSFGFGPPTGAAGGASLADFDTLIELITTTIEPDTWEEVGGQGSISGFPTNLSLIVGQTQDVHEQIADLLAQLRRFQDLQVTIEVRFITLNDNFFERIGIDFDFDIDDNTGLTPGEVAALDDTKPHVTVGLDPLTGTPTADLDLKFSQGSFGATAPTFGGFDPTSAASVGFAILSDIEAFFVIQAAQGDTRTNVLQAPKVTLFNGQTAFVSDTSQRPFVTSVIPVVGDFAAAHQPVITVLSEGTSLSVRAVVSQDRRFVRLDLVPFFSRVDDVETFTFDGSTTSDTGSSAVDPSDETSTVRNNEVTFTSGTTVQLPTFSFTTVSTTVSVPDGGTILLGGIKRLSEGRNEQGVPMLSKLPYVNRLFRNVGIGRDTQSLMMMVTPRIIIQEEEEEKLGISSTP